MMAMIYLPSTVRMQGWPASALQDIPFERFPTGENGLASGLAWLGLAQPGSAWLGWALLGLAGLCWYNLISEGRRMMERHGKEGLRQ